MDSYKSEGPASGAAGRAEAEDRRRSVRDAPYTPTAGRTQARGRFAGRARTTDAAFLATSPADRRYFASHPRRWGRVRDRTPEDPLAPDDPTTRVLIARFFKKLIGIDVPPETRDRNASWELFLLRVALPRDPEIDAVVEAVNEAAEP